VESCEARPPGPGFKIETWGTLVWFIYQLEDVVHPPIQPRKEKRRVLTVQTRAFAVFFVLLAATVTAAQQTPPPSESTALTIYNDNFAVARTTVDRSFSLGSTM
jgi:hypothetical protein